MIMAYSCWILCSFCTLQRCQLIITGLLSGKLYSCYHHHPNMDLIGINDRILKCIAALRLQHKSSEDLRHITRKPTTGSKCLFSSYRKIIKHQNMSNTIRCCSVTNSCLTLQPHGLQHTRLKPPLSPGVSSGSCPLSQWSATYPHFKTVT